MRGQNQSSSWALPSPCRCRLRGAEWSTDGINFQSAPGMVSNLTPIVLRRRSGAPGVTVTATLTVGDQSDDWVIRQPQPGDTTPERIHVCHRDQCGTATPTLVSNEITITEVDVPVWINVPNGEFFDPVTGLYQNSGYLSNGDTTRLRVLTGTPAWRVVYRVRAHWLHRYDLGSAHRWRRFNTGCLRFHRSDRSRNRHAR